jgi:hypothetical protein
MHVVEFVPAVVVGFLLFVRRARVRAIVVSAALALAGHAGAQVASSGVPGGMLSTRPGMGGVGVPGQVPGGKLSLQPSLGGLGVPGQVPGETAGTTQPCGYRGCNLVVPWLATGTPEPFSGPFSPPNPYNPGGMP